MTETRYNGFVTFLYIVLLIPFMRIIKINNILGSSVLQMWQIASVVFFVLLLFLRSETIKFTKSTILFFIYQIVIIITTTVYQGISMGIYMSVAATFLVFLLIQIDFKEIITAICFIAVPSIIINLYTLMNMTGEQNELFFLGGKNALALIIVPYLFIFIIRSLYFHDGKMTNMTKCMAVLCVISVLIGKSATGIVVIVLAVAMILVALKYKINKIALISVVLFFYFVMLFFSDGLFSSEFWLSFTEGMGKDATLTSRTMIWEAVTYLIRQKPILGYGRGLEFRYDSMYFLSAMQFEAHNFVLQILLDGGIVALLFYGAFLFSLVKKLNIKYKLHRVLFISIFIIIVNGLTESNVNTMYVTMLLGMSNFIADKENEHVSIESK